MPASVLREIAYLKELHHRNVIKLTDVVHSMADNRLSLVYEHCDQDLKKYLDCLTGDIEPDIVKKYMYV